MLTDGLLKIIESCLPFKTAVEGDKVGLQIQSGKTEVFNILITLEITDEVISEALINNIDCIITFHPLIYHPITSITDLDRVGFLTTKLIKNSISVISIHTTFDCYIKGTSRLLSDKLGLNFEKFLVNNEEFSGYGMGVISNLDQPINALDFFSILKGICNSPIKYCFGKNLNIQKIGIVGGSGSNYIDSAISNECDAFICSDISYHKFHYSQGRIWLIDVGHYEMEQFVPQGLFQLLKDIIKKEDIHNIRISKTLTNPINYYPKENYLKNQKEYLLSINDKW